MELTKAVVEKVSILHYINTVIEVHSQTTVTPKCDVCGFAGCVIDCFFLGIWIPKSAICRFLPKSLSLTQNQRHTQSQPQTQ